MLTVLDDFFGKLNLPLDTVFGQFPQLQILKKETRAENLINTFLSHVHADSRMRIFLLSIGTSLEKPAQERNFLLEDIYIGLSTRILHHCFNKLTLNDWKSCQPGIQEKIALCWGHFQKITHHADIQFEDVVTLQSPDKRSLGYYYPLATMMTQTLVGEKLNEKYIAEGKPWGGALLSAWLSYSKNKKSRFIRSINIDDVKQMTPYAQHIGHSSLLKLCYKKLISSESKQINSLYVYAKKHHLVALKQAIQISLKDKVIEYPDPLALTLINYFPTVNRVMKWISRWHRAQSNPHVEYFTLTTDKCTKIIPIAQKLKLEKLVSACEQVMLMNVPRPFNSVEELNQFVCTYHLELMQRILSIPDNLEELALEQLKQAIYYLPYRENLRQFQDQLEVQWILKEDNLSYQNQRVSISELAIKNGFKRMEYYCFLFELMTYNVTKHACQFNLNLFFRLIWVSLLIKNYTLPTLCITDNARMILFKLHPIWKLYPNVNLQIHGFDLSGKYDPVEMLKFAKEWKQVNLIFTLLERHRYLFLPSETKTFDFQNLIMIFKLSSYPESHFIENLQEYNYIDIEFLFDKNDLKKMSLSKLTEIALSPYGRRLIPYCMYRHMPYDTGIKTTSLKNDSKLYNSNNEYCSAFISQQRYHCKDEIEDWKAIFISPKKVLTDIHLNLLLAHNLDYFLDLRHFCTYKNIHKWLQNSNHSTLSWPFKLLFLKLQENEQLGTLLNAIETRCNSLEGIIIEKDANLCKQVVDGIFADNSFYEYADFFLKRRGHCIQIYVYESQNDTFMTLLEYLLLTEDFQDIPTLIHHHIEYLYDTITKQNLFNSIKQHGDLISDEIQNYIIETISNSASLLHLPQNILDNLLGLAISALDDDSEETKILIPFCRKLLNYGARPFSLLLHNELSINNCKSSLDLNQDTPVLFSSPQQIIDTFTKFNLHFDHDDITTSLLNMEAPYA